MRSIRVLFVYSFNLLFCLLLSINTSQAQQKIYFVKAGADGDGTSWAKASGDLVKVLKNAGPNSSIWVAKGTYYPVDDIPATALFWTFRLKSGVKLLGGFAGNEDPDLFNLSNRDFITNETILSGKISEIDNFYPNVYRVVAAVETNANTLIDGFTIKDGVYRFGQGSPDYEVTPSRNGAGLIVKDGGLTVKNCIFENNITDNGAGAVYVTNSEAIFEKCTFRKNITENSSGGAVLIRSNQEFAVTFLGCNFYENQTESISTGRGAAVAMESGKKLIIKNSVFENNLTAATGAVSAVQSTEIEITASTFKNNTATNRGGALFVAGISGKSVISNTNFIANSANATLGTVATGGAIFTNEVDLDIINSLFFNNTGKIGGSAISMVALNDKLRLINTTIAGHEIDNDVLGAINNRGSLEIINSIIYGNTDLSGGTVPFVYTDQSGSTKVSYSIIEGSGGSSSWNTDYGADEGNNLDEDPLFVNAAGGNFRLKFCSPAINTANDAALPLDLQLKDLDGKPRRFNNGHLDRGAYEYEAAPVFVKAGASGNADGSSWQDAYPTLQQALGHTHACSNEPLNIWVAQGTYYPTDGTDRSISFQPQNDIGIYGSFQGNEDPATFNTTQRNFTTHASVLSGNIGDATSIADNSYHVVKVPEGTKASAILDGFTISHGNASAASSPDDRGAGLLLMATGGTDSEPTLRNITFNNNIANGPGAALYVSAANDRKVDLVFERFNFIKNISTQAGGAIAMDDAGGTVNLIFSACRFQENEGTDGGAVFIKSQNVSATFINSLFTNNKGTRGGAMHISNSTASFYNTTLVLNEASNLGGAISLDAGLTEISNFKMINSLLWANTAQNQPDDIYFEQFVPLAKGFMKNSVLVEEGPGIETTDMISQDPWLGDAPDANGILPNCSPAINTGTDEVFNDAAIASYLVKDINNNERRNGTVDIGAVEFQGSITKPKIIALTPTSGAEGIFTDLSPGGELTLEFDQIVEAGNGVVELKKVSSDELARLWTINPDFTEGSGDYTFNDKTLTLQFQNQPEDKLEYLTNYYVSVSNQAIRSCIAGNYFSGFNSSEQWNFTTKPLVLIENVDGDLAISVLFGIPFSDIEFPFYQNFRDDEGNITEVEMLFFEEGYEPASAGTYMLEGEYFLPVYILNPDEFAPSIAVTVQPKKFISITKPEDIIVDLLTPFSTIVFPTTIEVEFDNGTKEDMPVSFAEGNFNNRVLGRYTLIGEISFDNNYINPDELEATIDVVVENINFAESPLSSLGIKIYPNPATDFINIGNQGTYAARLELLDSQGKMQTGLQLDPGQNGLIECSKLSRGLYFLMMRKGDRLIVTKVLLR